MLSIPCSTEKGFSSFFVQAGYVGEDVESILYKLLTVYSSFAYYCLVLLRKFSTQFFFQFHYSVVEILLFCVIISFLFVVFAVGQISSTHKTFVMYIVSLNDHAASSLVNEFTLLLNKVNIISALRILFAYKKKNSFMKFPQVLIAYTGFTL